MPLRLARLAPTLLFMLIAGCANVAGSAQPSPAIRTSAYVAADGARLYVLARGEDRQAPVLLWLHGGPGAPERPLFRYFNGGLEEHFVVAYWDQRGAGRSFDPDADPRRLTVSRHLADLDVIVDYLRRTLDRKDIVLVGHSWGAALGLLYAQAHPDKVSSLVCVDPLVDLRKAQQAQYAYVAAEARRRGDKSVLSRLRELGPPPEVSADAQLAMEDLADGYGAVFHTEPCKLCVAAVGLLTGVVTPSDMMSIAGGVHASLDAMTPELLDLDLARAVPAVGVPTLFVLGRYDRHVDARVAARYFEALRAPRKRLVWFEHSAHNVPFEEPRRFGEVLLDTLHAFDVQPAGG